MIIHMCKVGEEIMALNNEVWMEREEIMFREKKQTNQEYFTPITSLVKTFMWPHWSNHGLGDKQLRSDTSGLHGNT